MYGDAVQVVPARDGLELNVPRSARALLRAATRPTNRVATLTVARAVPERTTAEALAMGIDTRMASYKTYYSGTYDRITNLQLGVAALDGTLVAPGGTFSLNEAIGERTEERGFRPAPVIIGNEYAEEVGRRHLTGRDDGVQRRLGGGPEDHGAASALALHQPLPARPRRDRVLAVARPEVRERHGRLGARAGASPKATASASRSTAASRGASTAPRARSSSPGEVPIERVEDPTLAKGKQIVEEEGAPPSRTSATRKVYSADGELIHSETWTTSYEGQDRIVRVGTKVEPKAKPVPKRTKLAPATPSADDGAPVEPGATPTKPQP